MLEELRLELLVELALRHPELVVAVRLEHLVADPAAGVVALRGARRALVLTQPLQVLQRSGVDLVRRRRPRSTRPRRANVREWHAAARAHDRNVEVERLRDLVDARDRREALLAVVAALAVPAVVELVADAEVAELDAVDERAAVAAELEGRAAARLALLLAALAWHVEHVGHGRRHAREAVLVRDRRRRGGREHDVVRFTVPFGEVGAHLEDLQRAAHALDDDVGDARGPRRLRRVREELVHGARREAPKTRDDAAQKPHEAATRGLPRVLVVVDLAVVRQAADDVAGLAAGLGVVVGVVGVVGVAVEVARRVVDVAVVEGVLRHAQPPLLVPDVRRRRARGQGGAERGRLPRRARQLARDARRRERRAAQCRDIGTYRHSGKGKVVVGIGGGVGQVRILVDVGVGDGGAGAVHGREVLEPRGRDPVAASIGAGGAAPRCVAARHEGVGLRFIE